MKNQNRILFAFVFFLLGLVVFPSIGLTQVNSTQKQEKNPLLQQNQQEPVQTKEQLSFQEVQLKLMEQAFEKAVDPQTYRVGPGDIFSVVIWGDIQKAFQLPVTAEGNLVIPTVGSLQVADKTLAEVKKMVLQAGGRKYKKARVIAYLTGVRKIRVHVVGEVTQPGTFVATPLDRVSDLLARAGTFTDLALSSAIEIIHASGHRDTINYDRFRRFGEIKCNPLLNGGDIIHVLALNQKTPLVIVRGIINNSGVHAIIQGETLTHFLIRYGILDKSLNFKKIHIIRSDGAHLTLSFPSPKCNQFKLLNNDIISIQQLRNVVYVKGTVQKPGKYIYSPQFTALDYVGMAGGSEKSGSLRSIKVYHIANGTTEHGPDVIPQPGDVVELPETLRTRIISYFQIASQIASVVIAIAAVRNIRTK